MFTFALLCSFFIVLKYKHFPVFKPLSIYTILLVSLIIINSGLIGGQISLRLFYTVVLYLFCGYCVSIIARHIDKDALYRSWRFLGILVGIVVLIQYIQITFFGQYVQPINLLPLTKEEILSCENWIEYHERPVAFFTEPAAIVGFLTPLLALALQKRDFITSVIVSISILLTTSTSGLIVLLVLWATFFGDMKFSFWFFIFLILFLGSVLYVFLFTDLLQATAEKLIFEMSGESSNMYTRVIRGWDIFFSSDTRTIIWGIPEIDFTDYAAKHASEFAGIDVLTGTSQLFTNTAQKVCLYSGLFGAVVYVWMLTKLYNSVEKAAKPFFWSVIVLMFFASNFYRSGLFIMQFMVLLSFEKSPKRKEKLHMERSIIKKLYYEFYK